MRKGVGVVLALTALLGVLAPGHAAAHPLGDFSVNHASVLRVAAESVRVLFVVDLAEVPSVPALAELDADGDGTADDGERARYGAVRCAAYAAELDLRVDGVRRGFEVRGSTVFVLPGEAGLRTLRLECRLSTADSVVGARVTYTDGADAGRAGWREVTALGDGTRLVDSTVPERSRSDVLARYPGGDPERVSSAAFEVRSGGPAATAPASGARAESDGDLAALLGGEGWSGAMLAVLVAALLGAGHALTPGHGKTLMALYLTGTDGSLRDAVVVGASVTATHTLGVFLLAVLVSASALAAPESVYPWLGLAHGILVAGIGAGLLLWRHRRGHGHGHAHGHAHGARSTRRRTVGLVGFGVAGGLVPSPSALLVLLGAQALGREAFGVVLVLGYGVGMAVCLSSVGWLLARGGARLTSHPGRRGWLGWAARNLPVLAPSAIVCSGVFLAVRSLTQLPA